MSAPAMAKELPSPWAYYCKHCEAWAFDRMCTCGRSKNHKFCTTCGVIMNLKDDSLHDCKTKAVVPSSYQRRLLLLSKGGIRYPKTPDHQGGGWKTEWFGTNLQPKTFKEAQMLIAEWNKSCITSGMLVEYRLDLDLKCSKCDKKVHETFAGDVCHDCHMEDKKTMKGLMTPKKPLKFDLENAKPVTNFSNQFQSPIKKPVLLKREEGEFWEIPASSSPLWTKQWGYQGSAKEPYIISKRKKIDGSSTSDGWACSCKAFTQHSPRKDCKHIINIKHGTGIATVNPTKHAVANLDSDEAAAFAEFKRQKAANATQKPESGDADLALFGQTGRKFR